jgi:hypothetical protein
MNPERELQGICEELDVLALYLFGSRAGFGAPADSTPDRDRPVRNDPAMTPGRLDLKVVGDRLSDARRMLARK